MRMTDELTTRILLYSHDSYGLGHLRRTLAIAWGLSDAFPRASLLCVTGSPRAHSFPFPPRTDYLKLPAVTKDESGRYVPLKLRIPIEQLLAVRAAAIEQAVLEYKPHAILVDHAPLGLGGELVGTLRRVKAERPETRIFIGLRDICDDGPLVRESWHREGVGEALNELYDRILVYGQPAIFDVVREYGLADACARKLHYTGYIWRSEPDHASAAALPRPEAPMVLVTVGGGADGHPIVLRYLEGLAAAGPSASWRSVVVLGPLMSGSMKRQAREAARSLPDVTVLEFTPKLKEYLAQAAAVLTMGGYNTVVEGLALEKRLLVVPRVSPRREQVVRAERFAQRGLLRWVDPGAMTAAALIDAVREVLAGPPPAAGGMLDLGGVESTVRAIKQTLDGQAEEAQTLSRQILSDRIAVASPCAPLNGALPGAF